MMILSLKTVLTTIFIVLKLLIPGSCAATIIASNPFAIAGENYNLTCYTDKASEKVLWNFNDGAVRQSFLNCSTEDVIGNRSHRYYFLCMNKTTFGLTIPGTIIAEEHKASVRCQDGNEDSTPFIIDVFYKPNSNLTMTGYDGSIVFPGQNLTLKCLSNGGRPLANLSWTCDGKPQKGLNYNTSVESVSELNLDLNQNLSGKYCACIATHPLWQSSLEIRSNLFQVYYKPNSNLTMTGYDGSIVFPGQNLTLKCLSNGGRPLANLSWTCDGKPQKGLNYNTSVESVSELNLDLNQNLSGKYCACIATHPLWQSSLEIRSNLFQVYYASVKEPHISGYNHLQGIREGVGMNLTCTVYGGYPLPSLTLTCDDTVMDTINRSTDGVAKIVLPLFINRTFNGRQCFCNGTSPANYSGSSNITFIVNYPPTVTLVSYEERVLNRTKYSMYCQIYDGNPSNYMILWSQTVADIVVRTNTDLASLKSSDGQNLTLIASSYNDTGLYTCSVHNNVTDLHGNLLQNNSVYIQKNFSAIFTLTNNYVFHAINETFLEVRIPFYCQPAVKSIDDLMWFKGDNEEQLLEQKKNIKFYLKTTKIQIRFYYALVMVDGQMAVMTINLINYTTKGQYVLKVRNMDDVYEKFRFKIEVDDQDNTKLLLIIGIVAPVLISITAVAIIIHIVKKRRTSYDNEKDKKQSLSKDNKGKTEPNDIPMAEVTPFSNSSSEQIPIGGQINSGYLAETDGYKPDADIGLVKKIHIGIENQSVHVIEEAKKPDSDLQKFHGECKASIKIQEGRKPEQVYATVDKTKGIKMEKETVKNKANDDSINNRSHDAPKIEPLNLNDISIKNKDNGNDGMIYVDPDFSKSSGNDIVIHSKGNGVEYAEIKR